jgi:hypothetical protein
MATIAKCHPIFHAVRGRCSPRLNNVAAPNMKMTKEVRPGMMRGTQDDPKVLIIWHPVYRHPGLIYDVTIVPSLPSILEPALRMGVKLPVPKLPLSRVCPHVPSFALYKQDDFPSTALFPKRVCFRRIA